MPGSRLGVYDRGVSRITSGSSAWSISNCRTRSCHRRRNSRTSAAEACTAKHPLKQRPGVGMGRHDGSVEIRSNRAARVAAVEPDLPVNAGPEGEPVAPLEPP